MLMKTRIKKIVTTGILAIVIVLAGWQLLNWLEESAQNVPEEYRETYLNLEKILKDFDVYLNSNWHGEKYNVSFGANLLPVNLHAGEDLLKEEYYNKTVAYLNALKSLGVREIHIDIGYPLLSRDYPRSDEFLAFYKKIAEEIKKRGLKFHAEFEFAMQSPESSGWTRVSYQNFTKTKVEEIMLYYANLTCSELKPDYYTIIDEPTTQNQRFNLELTVEDWTNIVSSIGKNLNCSALIGVGGGTWEEELIKSFASKIEIDFINIHLYGVHQNNLYKLIEIAEFVKSKGKKVAIGEAWLHSGGQNSLKDKWRYSDVFSFWEPLDSQFMKILIKLSHFLKLEFVDPFFTNYFFAYLDYNQVMENQENYMPPEKGLKIALDKAMENAEKEEFTRTGLAYGDAIGRLSSVEIAIVYGTVIDQTRDINSIANLIAELKVDFIHRGFFRWRGLAKLEREYDVYGTLAEYIAAIKESNPSVIFGGAIAAQEINVIEYDPLKGRVIAQDKVWEMALDPLRYGFNLTKQELHEKYWEITGSEDYIFPDLLNPDFQELFLNHVKMQVDSGVDAVWIDGLFWQAGIFARLANSTSHPSIEKVLNTTRRIVDEIHTYGALKGKHIYVGSWAQTDYPYPTPNLDFVTVSPSAEEVKEKRLNETKWIEKINQIRKKYDEVPIISFIDWAFTADTPLGVFSQTLTKEEQKETLRSFDEFFKEKGIIFAYPVHGGYMGRDATELAFGKDYKYDALAPEFDTYETIRELAKKLVSE